MTTTKWQATWPQNPCCPPLPDLPICVQFRESTEEEPRCSEKASRRSTQGALCPVMPNVVTKHLCFVFKESHLPLRELSLRVQDTLPKLTSGSLNQRPLCKCMREVGWRGMNKQKQSAEHSFTYKNKSAKLTQHSGVGRWGRHCAFEYFS